MAYKNVITDPRQHHSTNFVYIVRGIAIRSKPFDVNKAKETIRTILDPTNFFSASLVGILSAEAAKSRLGWRNGEIRQTHIYGESFGLIINPAYEENIHIAWHGDIDSPRNPETLRTFAAKHKGKVEDPLVLLTRAIVRTELVIRGNNSIGSIQGIFILDESNKARVDGDRMSLELKREEATKYMKFLRREYAISLPVIEEHIYYDTTRSSNYFNEVQGKFDWY